MFLLQGFLVGIKPSHFHVFHGAFSITAMWADIEIIVANDHKGVIDGRFHLETIAVLHDEGVFLHDLPLSVANIEVITAKRLIWFRIGTSFGFASATKPFLGSIACFHLDFEMIS